MLPLRSRLRMWRTRARTMTFNVTIFLLGVLSCLLCLQINSNNRLLSSGGVNCAGGNLFGSSGETSYYVDAIAQARAQIECNCPCGESGSIKGNHPPPPPAQNNYYEEVISEHLVGAAAAAVGKNSLLPKGKNNSVAAGVGRRWRKLGLNATTGVGLPSLSSSGVTMSTSDNNNNNNINNNEPGYDGLSSSPTVWVVTPTFYRPEQKPELTRVAQALLPVSHFVHWVVVDDVSQGSETSLRDLQGFLERFPLTFTLLKSLGRSEKLKVVGKPRGVGGRRAAIAWLRHNAQDGVVYFADDDNTYDSEIFRQMQHTKKVSMWPVGLVTELGVSSPIVRNGRVVGFYDGWNGLRKFPVDMAGFAINMELFHSTPSANMPWVAGYEEDELLRSLGVKVQDIAPLANECTEILVWHTKAVRNSWPRRPRNLKPQILANTNLNKLLVQLPQQSLAGPESSTKTIKTEENKFSFIKFFFGSL